MRASFENEIPSIHFKNVSFSYPDKKENLIFKCNFSIEKTGFWMIVGKNGSGKSTLLKLINGIIKPKNGIINCNANIGTVFQNPDHQILMPNCRSELLINIEQSMSDYEITKKIDYVLGKVGLAGFEKRPVHTLSGGQKQRLTIACALIRNSNFILMDEPTAFLDEDSQLNVLNIIRNLTKSKSKPFAALWITHRLEELGFADGVAEMKDGNLSDWKNPSKFKYK